MPRQFEGKPIHLRMTEEMRRQIKHHFPGMSYSQAIRICIVQQCKQLDAAKAKKLKEEGSV